MEFLIKQLQARRTSFQGTIDIETDLIKHVLLSTPSKERHEQNISQYAAHIDEINFILGFIDETKDKGL